MQAAHTSAADPARRAHDAEPPTRRSRRLVRDALAALCALSVACALSGCASGGAGAGLSASGEQDPSQSQTSGPAYERPELAQSPFDEAAATGQNGVKIDASHLAQGYVAVAATANVRLKFQVESSSSDLQYYYDLPNDGTPISCPLTMGDGTYSFTVWENTSGTSYVELDSLTGQQVTLADEFQPFIRPSVYCPYDADSASTKLANELCADAQNEGDVVRSVYEWIVGNVAYDEGKASALANATGYLPNPDDTVAAASGICFDYASLAAAMLRSQGIPCKIITGYVSPDNIYHAWNMVYIDGTWVDTRIDIKADTWTRIDTTFAAGSGSSYVGDGTTYSDSLTY